MEIITNSTEETREFAYQIAKKTKPGDTLALYGDLGSGKTTFVRFLVEALGLKNRVQSPTFVIIRKYGNLNHIDLYRLTSEEEVKDLGLGEILNDRDSITVIEWPELTEEILPVNTKRIYFEYVDENIRKIKI